MVTKWGVMPLGKPGVPTEFVQIFGRSTWRALGLEPLVDGGEPQLWVFTLSDFLLGGGESGGGLVMGNDCFTEPCAVRLQGGSILCDEEVMRPLSQQHPHLDGLPEDGEDEGEAFLITRISVATKQPITGAGDGVRVIVLHSNRHMDWSARLLYQQRRTALVEYGCQLPAEQRKQSQRWRKKERKLKAQGRYNTLQLPLELHGACPVV